MAIGDYDAIDRATLRLRDEPEPGWQAIQQTVIAAVRATPRGGWPLDVEDPRPGPAGVLRVSDLVVSSMVSRALAADPDFTVIDIDIASDAAVLRSVSVTLSGRYHCDLVAATARARVAVDAVLADTIGSRAAGAVVYIRVGDVHR